MFRLPAICGLGLLSLALLVGAGTSQDTKKVKGMLPPGFKALGLSKAQVTQIYTVQTEYRGKYADLDKQLKDLKKKEQQEIFQVLTAAQRDQYLKAKGVVIKSKEKSK